MQFNELMAKKMAWESVLQKLPEMQEGPFKALVEHYHRAAGAILSEAADFWVGAMANARANIGPFQRGMDLKGAFQNIPAIIVGAGASLQKNGHFLQKLKDKALILAGGAALEMLDVAPHFAASIDPKAPPIPTLNVPFCYQSRMDPDNFQKIGGEKILFPDSSCEAINWIHGDEMFDGGWTVGTFLSQIAIHFGCSPIIFVGMDLSYENGRKYANIDRDAECELIEVDGFVTQKDWLLAARFIEEKKVKMFDASQGMLKLPKIDLERLDLPSVHIEYKNLTVHNTNRWEEWDASFRRCMTHLNDEEIVYQKLLKPLWAIWAPVFARESQNLDLHKMLFFENVLKEHEAVILSKR